MRFGFMTGVRTIIALCVAIINRGFMYKYPISDIAHDALVSAIQRREAPIWRVRTYKRHSIVTWLDYVVRTSSSMPLTPR